MAKAPELTKKELDTPPPRIIRTCCSFGYDVRIAGIPGSSVSDIADLSTIGAHVFLGNKEEGNGIIYTQKGGFVDLGHLRDMADWTAYLYVWIKSEKDHFRIIKELGHEGGEKMLEVSVPEFLSDEDMLLIAGRVAYDLSVWHEIATWFGVSYIPLIPERYSSFSMEDNYSNLLGIQLGMEAIKSEEGYEQAMTKLLYQKLIELESVEGKEETTGAMDKVEGLWWTREKKLPNSDFLVDRNFDCYYELIPWLVDSDDSSSREILKVPRFTTSGHDLQDYYRLSIDLNYKFPLRKILPLRGSRVISQKDFNEMILWVAGEWYKETTKRDEFARELNREFRKNRLVDPDVGNKNQG